MPLGYGGAAVLCKALASPLPSSREVLVPYLTKAAVCLDC